MKSVLSVLLTLCLASISFAQEGHNMQSLELTVSRESGEIPTGQLGPLRIMFKNVTRENVRLLRMFSDENAMRYWFSVVVTATNGTPVLGVQSGGKISMRGAKEYLVLGPQECFGFRLDASKLVPQLAPGSYSIKVVYRNQYGENCFCGKLESNSLNVTVNN